ncbi:MAG: PAS domain S-box protein [Bacteroidales bacterium]|jgi:PAS domain S-box-containing protein|nr:PAS domain S-box protein [Bacteroidales bacterium]
MAIFANKIFPRLDMIHNKPKIAQGQIDAESIYLHARTEELERKLFKQENLEQMVEESEQRFKQILSLTYDGIILYEKNSGEIIEANLRLIHKLKYKRDHVIGKSVYEFVIPAQQDIIRERLAEDLPNVYETVILDRDGQSFEFEICSRSCYYQGRKVKMAAVCDISYRKQYEKTLRESEEKFRSLSENTNDSIILTDQTEIIYVNPSTPHVFGLADEPLIDLPQVLTHIHPDDRAMAESLIHSVAMGHRQTKYSQFRIITKDGKERWIWSRVFPVVPDNPDNTKLVILSSDITEMHEKEEIRKKTEIAARTAEEKYKVLTSLLPEMVIETDTTERLTFVNLKTIEVFEYGSDFYTNNLRFIELISKEDRQRCTEDFQKIIAGEAVTPPEVEYTAVTKSGRKFPVMVHATRMYTNNEFAGLSIVMFDITAKKSAERKALNYEESMTFLANSALKFLSFPSDDDIFIFIGKNLSRFASKSIVVVFSYDQSNNTSNIRYISGIYPHINELMDILGKPPEDFTIKLPSKIKSKYLSEKKLKKLDNELRCAIDNWPVEKAEQIQKLLNIVNVYSMGMVRNGKLYGGLLIATNSSADPLDTKTIETFIYQAGIALHRKQIDNKLMKAKVAAEESDRLKSAFLANMSHEVRTPLNGILGLAQVLMKSEEIDPAIRNDVKMIVESGSSLLALIEDIMDVSKIEAGQMKIKYKPFVLNTLLDQLYSMFLANPLYLQKEQNIKLTYDKPEDNISLMSDPDRLQQIFINLIGNALKFTQKGFVQFGYSIRKQVITFYVKDSGIGIPADKTERIFERFTQVDNTLARKFSGSGLGLAISKGLATLLEGKMWCESDLGKGSNFYFTIPYRPTTMLASSDTPQKKSVTDYNWGNYTVLIVEDDTINFKVIEAMLRNTKINITHADNGLKAIEQVNLNPQINLVLMDVHLPEMSGLEATGRILKINPSLPIIAQTANAMSEDKDKCLEAGCADYISKPIDMGDLFTKIAKFLPNE